MAAYEAIICKIGEVLENNAFCLPEMAALYLVVYYG